MNEQRADWAAEALSTFQRATGTDNDTLLGDFLCDLLHWCHREDQDFDAALERAREHYAAETGQPGPLTDGEDNTQRAMELVREVATCPKDGDIVDGAEYCADGNDAEIDTLYRFINAAREITKTG